MKKRKDKYMYFLKQRYTTGLKIEFETSTGDSGSMRETGLYHKTADGFEALLEIAGVQFSQSDIRDLLPLLTLFAETGKLEEAKEK